MSVTTASGVQGLALFLLLAFRTNSSYERWWEGKDSRMIKPPPPLPGLVAMVGGLGTLCPPPHSLN